MARMRQLRPRPRNGPPVPPHPAGIHPLAPGPAAAASQVGSSHVLLSPPTSPISSDSDRLIAQLQLQGYYNFALHKRQEIAPDSTSFLPPTSPSFATVLQPPLTLPPPVVLPEQLPTDSMSTSLQPRSPGGPPDRPGPEEPSASQQEGGTDAAVRPPPSPAPKSTVAAEQPSPSQAPPDSPPRSTSLLEQEAPPAQSQPSTRPRPSQSEDNAAAPATRTRPPQTSDDTEALASATVASEIEGDKAAVEITQAPAANAGGAITSSSPRPWTLSSPMQVVTTVYQGRTVTYTYLPPTQPGGEIRTIFQTIDNAGTGQDSAASSTLPQTFLFVFIGVVVLGAILSLVWCFRTIHVLRSRTADGPEHRGERRRLRIAKAMESIQRDALKTPGGRRVLPFRLGWFGTRQSGYSTPEMVGKDDAGVGLGLGTKGRLTRFGSVKSLESCGTKMMTEDPSTPSPTLVPSLMNETSGFMVSTQTSESTPRSTTSLSRAGSAVVVGGTLSSFRSIEMARFDEDPVMKSQIAGGLPAVANTVAHMRSTIRAVAAAGRPSMDVASFTGSVLSMRSNESARSTAGATGGLHMRHASHIAMVTGVTAPTSPPAVADKRRSASLDFTALRAPAAAAAAVSRSNSVSLTGKPLTQVPEEEDASSADKPSAPSPAAVPRVVPRKVATRLDTSGIYTRSCHLPFYGGPPGTVVAPAPLPPAASKAAVSEDTKPTGDDAEAAPSTSAVCPRPACPAANDSPSPAAADAEATLHASSAGEPQASGSESSDSFRTCDASSVGSSLERPPLEEPKKVGLAPNPFASTPEPAAVPAASTVVTPADTATVPVTSAATMTTTSAAAAPSAPEESTAASYEAYYAAYAAAAAQYTQQQLQGGQYYPYTYDSSAVEGHTSTAGGASSPTSEQQQQQQRQQQQQQEAMWYAANGYDGAEAYWAATQQYYYGAAYAASGVGTVAEEVASRTSFRGPTVAGGEGEQQGKGYGSGASTPSRIAQFRTLAASTVGAGGVTRKTSTGNGMGAGVKLMVERDGVTMADTV
ncbi:hypothetical protein HDU96_010221 [Phlyctochytrium bullatum]|nr:hypothetical protein HDU96_010221 [Phlyctochytrium bullatum]